MWFLKFDFAHKFAILLYIRVILAEQIDGLDYTDKLENVIILNFILDKDKERNKRYEFGDGFRKVKEIFTKKKTYNVGSGSYGAQQPANNFYSSGGSGSSSLSSSSSSSSSYGSFSSSESSSSSNSGGGYVNVGRPCTSRPREIANTIPQCSLLTNACVYQCIDGHQFPTGDIKMKMICNDGDWVLENIEWNDKIACEPICIPPCQHNGICSQPGVCQCSEGFVGPYCEQEKKFCLTRPPVPQNSKMSCSSTSCAISCAKGYTFPDGSSITNMICKDGQWASSRANQTSIPNCEPTCNPQCENKGNCISYNVCQCQENFRGNLCQYNVDVCSPKKMNFNGAYKCSGDSLSLQCKLTCPAGIAFISQPAAEYICRYDQGYFVPSLIPQCNFTTGMEIMRGPETSHSYSALNQTTVLSGNTKRKVKKIRKKVHHGVGDDDDGSYEKIIEKTKIIVKKGRKKGSGTYGSEEEYEEYEDFEDTDAMNGMQAFGVYSLYVSNDLSIKHRVPKAATCTTWNGNKLKTFDGLIYSHDLRCSYTLVQDKIDGSFSVSLRGCGVERDGHCSHIIEILMSNTKFIILNMNNSVVLFKEDKQMAIPMQIMGLRITKIGSNHKINLELIGLTIIWDGQRMINIEATPALFNRTAGLCGTLDQQINNDFASRDGVVHKSVSTFVNAWKQPHSTQHCDNHSLELVCTEAMKTAATTICNKLINNQKFQNCLAKMKKEVLLEACISDYCYCSHNNRQQCACNGITVFAKECQFQGITLSTNWRDMEMCPLTCDDGRIYKACGPTYEQTCGSAAVENVVIGATNCNEGCFCPDGMIQHETKCIRINECPCALRGKALKPGSVVKKDCNTCKCEKGIWKCSDKSCGARCAVVGDPHYVSFDGKRFDFQGACSYYLLKTDEVEIVAENIPCPGSISESMNFAPAANIDMPTCTKSVTIKVKHGGETATIQLKQGREILVDNTVIIRIPAKIFDDLIKIQFASSTMLSVHFRDGLNLWWDGMTRVYIDAPPSYRGKTNGLCGTFDSNQQNDFLTPEGDIESSVASFANKWRTKETCAYVDDDVNVPHPCQANLENKQMAIDVCKKLKSKIFDDCHWYVDPESYYEDCLYDICAAASKGDITASMCTIFAAYANECSQQGSIIDWRQSIPECGIKCPAGQIYEECSTDCFRACSDIETSLLSCQTRCVEGCRCPKGQALDDQNECIPITMCPCIYKGLTFNAGYKEIRPGTKHLDLCTCSGVEWKCIEATASDKDNYPPAADIRNQCLIDNNEEFTTCKPTEPRTCKNMDSYIEQKTIECRPGCVCKKDYVLDVSLKKCVRPVDCSCHHGSKSYGDRGTIKTDCNTCLCKSGNWQCTNNVCPATCTVYGDSHFITYDKKDYSFQGACSYVLSKGALRSGEAFTITMQNVMCGSQGVTCSKSVTIALLGSTNPESVTLNSDTTVPGTLLSRNEIGEIEYHGTPNRIKIHRAGVFVVVEIVELGIMVKWDRGTRIYVKLSNKWQNNVQGLCGNFDGDAANDFTSPSTGLETNAILFGDSWKLENFCPQPVEQIDACSVHPARKIWAVKQCGILKSHVFSSCHSEVEVDGFLKSCIFDACACDQGGDCEYLCTGIAAYAHACTMKGVHIRWRTPALCPMQCDAHCSEYKPCISTCAIETCDNVLNSANRLCSEDSCVEGCAYKPCPEGYIYTNSSYSECVPKSICRPVCLSRNGIDYYEGDEIHSDNCQTCHCSKGKKLCIGAPCTASTTVPYHVPSNAVNQGDASVSCKSGWSEWINQEILNDGDKQKDNTKIGDHEPLPNGFILKNYRNSAFCDADYMSKIECRSVDTHQHPKAIDEDVECSLERGLICQGQCHDYEIRVYCDCNESIEILTLPTIGRKTHFPKKSEEIHSEVVQQTITESTNIILVENKNNSICDAAIPHVEKPGDCHQFYHCAMNGSGVWRYVEKACGKNMMFNPQIMVCDHISHVLKVKPQCGETKPIHKYEILDDLTVEKIVSFSTEGIIRKIENNIKPSSFSSICDPTIPHVEKPGNCHQFYHCAMNASGVWTFVEKTCGNDMMFNPQAMVCDHIANVQKIKPQCGEEPTVIETSNQMKYEHSCSVGKVWSECAILCGRSCHFYDNFLQKNGLCTSNHNYCEPGCVDQSVLAIDCPSGQFWRDNKTCVKRSDCTCRSEEGNIVKPGSIYEESECKVCQCIDNAYVCEDSTCVLDDKAKKVTSDKKYITKSEKHKIITNTQIIKEPIIINTVTPPQDCEPNRLVPLMNGINPISDSAFNASSYLTSFFEPQYSRLDSKRSPESSGCWSPETNDQTQYLEINFDKPEPIYGVMMQGSPIFDQYVTSFKIVYSYDGKNLHHVIDETKNIQVFSGPIDSRTPVKSMFKVPIEAKMVRIYPLTWHGSISVRVELLGCSPFQWQKLQEQTTMITPHHNDIVEKKPICDEPLGLENGNLHIDQISLSSLKLDSTKDLAKQSLKLSSASGWQPNIDSPNEYVVFDFMEPRNITGMRTKGGANCWVTAYTIHYTKDLIVWNKILSADGKGEQLFLANFDSSSEKSNYFRFPIQATAMKITPIKWHQCIELKIEPIGCYVPYKYKSMVVIDKPTVLPTPNAIVCNVCPEIVNSPSMNEGICPCKSAQFWNGVKCVDRNFCPCVIDHLTYGIGAQFERSDCSQCICVIGGIAQCKPRECRCGAGLRPKPTASCLCECEACKANEVLCPNSGSCIPEKSWCDGIIDCEDDEINCNHKSQYKQKTVKKITEKVVITQMCSTPKCPPGFNVKMLPPKKQKSSAILTSAESLSEDDVLDEIFKASNDHVESKYQSKLPLPATQTKIKKKPLQNIAGCPEYDCIPEKPVTISTVQEKVVCPEPSCPIGYQVVYDQNNNLSPSCAKYKCEPIPIKDVVCNVTGRTFNTFDEIEYKYDICDHILVRSLTSKWIISLQLNCTAGNFVCHKQVVIVDKSCDLVVVLHTDLSLTLDGFEFSVEQLQQSIYSQMDMFTVSRLGNSILFVSPNQGFWVRLDNDGDVKVGVSSKYISHLDGLCGFYNEFRDDDKRTPNGTTVVSTIDFGDSWVRDESSKGKCTPHACSQQTQDLAWELCSKVRDATFASCSKSINPDNFISKCLDTACECLRSRSPLSQNQCQCSILQNYVTECLAVDENLHFDTWRSKFDCSIDCPPTLVHRDCYRRRCELSCGTLGANDCPYIPGQCFSGCYCPENTVRKGERCVEVSECKDCICDGFGRSQFISYDRKNFTFDGQGAGCNYLLSRDINLSSIHAFQVYASLGKCDNFNSQGTFKHSCTKALHILYGEHIIHLQHNNSNGGSIIVFVDGIQVHMPHEKDWVLVATDTGNSLMKVNLVKSSVELNAIFNDLSFSIKIPSVKYSNQVEGWCGNCNGVLDDDIKPNPKHLNNLKSDSLNEILQTWLADEPALNETDTCISDVVVKNNCVPLPPEKDPCLQLLDAQIFGKCHLVVEAFKYVSMCQIDMCNVGPEQKGACSHLAAYARECSRNGICVDWKRGSCSEQFECPNGMEYKACSCHKTCEAINGGQQISDQKCTEPTEDCFCRDGNVLNANGKCVPQNQCLPCDDSKYFAGDKWQSDKCTQCECSNNGKVICTKKECSNSGIICQLGFKQVTVNANDNDCCQTFKCIPEIVSEECPEKPMPTCADDQFVKIIIDKKNCTSFVCECKPVSECKIIKLRPLKTGEQVVDGTTGCCRHPKIVCKKSECPPKLPKCDKEFYEVTEKEKVDENDCCPEFICVPPKHMCIVEESGKKIAKKLGHVWRTADPCLKQKCIYSNGAQIPIVAVEKETCPISDCPIGFKMEIVPGKCCGECKQQKCLVDQNVFDVDATWTSDNCTLFKCNILSNQFVISSSMPNCPDISDCPKDQRYFNDCCERCKLKTEDKKLCLAMSLSEAQTVGMIELTIQPHGICKNTQPIRGFTECTGACSSSTKFNRSTRKQDKKCSCCSVDNYEELKVPVKCVDGTKDIVPVFVPKTCNCQPCDDGGEKFRSERLLNLLNSTPVY